MTVRTIRMPVELDRRVDAVARELRAQGIEGASYSSVIREALIQYFVRISKTAR